MTKMPRASSSRTISCPSAACHRRPGRIARVAEHDRLRSRRHPRLDIRTSARRRSPDPRRRLDRRGTRGDDRAVMIGEVRRVNDHFVAGIDDGGEDQRERVIRSGGDQHVARPRSVHRRRRDQPAGKRLAQARQAWIGDVAIDLRLADCVACRRRARWSAAETREPPDPSEITWCPAAATPPPARSAGRTEAGRSVGCDHERAASSLPEPLDSRTRP